MSTYRGVNARLAQCLNSVLNEKAVVAAFNQEKDLVGAFSVIVKTGCVTNGQFYSTSWDAELEMFEVKNNGNLISGLAGTTSAQLTAAQVVRCSTSPRTPAPSMDSRTTNTNRYLMALK